MNTTTHRVPILRQTGMDDYVFLLEDMEFAMPKKQLKRVTKRWNQGKGIKEIAKNERRDVIEILFALVHQAKRGHKLRPFEWGI